MQEDFFNFKPDPFQRQSCEFIDQGKNVLVCAPTSSGKTAVAEYAIARALSKKKRLSTQHH